jgi:nucleoside 2-deoxyribosyltransferase
MRSKGYLSSESSLKDSYEHADGLASVLSSSKGITTRDRWDTSRCDLMIVNLLGTEKVSIGTMMEIAWADMLRKPVILVIEDEGNPHDHAMVRESIGFRVSSLSDAVRIAAAMK